MTELKAYSVLETDENTGGIVFAKSNIEARRNGSAEFGTGELGGWSVHRAPWADAFSPGPVPKVEMVKAGWHFECWHCGRRISSDEYDDNDDPIEFTPVELGEEIFCCQGCLDAEVEQKADQKRITAETIADLSSMLLQKMPGAVIDGSHYVYVPRHTHPIRAEQAILSFTFPGERYGFASFRFDGAGNAPQVHVCNGDRAAFYRWRAEGYPPHMMDAQP